MVLLHVHVVNTCNSVAERQPCSTATCISVDMYFCGKSKWLSYIFPKGNCLVFCFKVCEGSSFCETQPHCTWKEQQAHKDSNSPVLLIDLVFRQGATLFHTSYLLLKWLSLWRRNLLTFQTAGWGRTVQLSVCFDSPFQADWPHWAKPGH